MDRLTDGQTPVKHYLAATSFVDGNKYSQLHSVINTKRHHHGHFSIWCSFFGKIDRTPGWCAHKSRIRHCCGLSGHTVENCGHFKMYFLVAGPYVCLIRVRKAKAKAKTKAKVKRRHFQMGWCIIQFNVYKDQRKIRFHVRFRSV